ncbi:M4 family metallopeptidase [Nocardioides sp. KC13]|uniref:Neutral metalloproteinase n=1 Tax=Nocardioides turkmenicus TaxID=2711220 RepID=A0A6M1R1D6_9ACTN|nr:protealysin inhibitor emfourin [Nocardioides sp. KC13]NGN93522.1 M4 family metallopeptidase [Nocardioides sp. KC13]
MTSRKHVCHIVPPYLMQRLDPGRLDQDQGFRAARSEHLTRVLTQRPAPEAGSTAAEAGDWTVYTAGNGTDLPGEKVRAAGEPESGDETVDEAAAGITGSLALFEEVYGRDSYDGQGIEVVMTVHYDRNYANAFWDGTQLVFGDGDGEVFQRFTKAVDVIGHELSHAVTEHTAGLVYQGQPGALNEHISDVYGSCIKQRLLGQSADEADWIIGAGLFTESVQGVGLRHMLEPGTAYDDPNLGKDPQPAHMDDIYEGPDDNGGVHINSGIPNRAFALAAKAIGGNSWDGAGKIWYAALTNGAVTTDTDFAGFAAATIAEAGEHVDAVTTAWSEVGVTPASGAPGAPGPDGESPTVVRVRRSGGFLGRTSEGSVELAPGDSQAATVRDLLANAGPSKPKGADRYIYEFEVDGQRTVVHEGDLSPELRELANRMLEQ